MHIVLTVEDISKLSHSARAGCCPSLSKAHVDTREYPAGFDSSRFEGEPYPGQIESFMEGCSEKTVAGLRVIAEHGPVIHAKLLNDVGIENYGSFQGGVTKRTRTITGDSEACYSPSMIGRSRRRRGPFCRHKEHFPVPSDIF
jgi:hypothetical protein